MQKECFIKDFNDMFDALFEANRADYGYNRIDSESFLKAVKERLEDLYARIVAENKQYSDGRLSRERIDRKFWNGFYDFITFYVESDDDDWGSYLLKILGKETDISEAVWDLLDRKEGRR